MIMRIFVHAKPGAHATAVEKISEKGFRVSVAERPTGGKANRAIEKALAEHFGVSPSQVEIISGHASKTKLVDIIL